MKTVLKNKLKPCLKQMKTVLKTEETMLKNRRKPCLKTDKNRA
jgi:hypothetical protein